MYLSITFLLLYLRAIKALDGSIVDESNERSKLLQSQTNTTKECSLCTDTLLGMLNKVHQNILFANKTINPERIVTRMNKVLSELEDSYNEHSIGLKLSQESFAYSLDNLASSLEIPTTKELTLIRLIEIIDKLESSTHSMNKRLDIKINPVQLLNDNINYLLLYLDSTIGKHINQQDEVIKIRIELENFSEQSYSDRESTKVYFGNLIRKQSESLISDQAHSIDQVLKSNHQQVSSNLIRINSLIEEIRSYRACRAASIIDTWYRSIKHNNSLSFPQKGILSTLREAEQSTVMNHQIASVLSTCKEQWRTISSNESNLDLESMETISTQISNGEQKLAHLSRHLRDSEEQISELILESATFDSKLESLRNITKQFELHKSKLEQFKQNNFSIKVLDLEKFYKQTEDQAPHRALRSELDLINLGEGILFVEKVLEDIVKIQIDSV